MRNKPVCRAHLKIRLHADLLDKCLQIQRKDHRTACLHAACKQTLHLTSEIPEVEA
jgi:hypothetical protein